jgi:phosphatidylglycerophosphate synthase
MEIQIHRTGKVADWDAIPHGARNRWQRTAAATHGYVAPGNVVSLIGAVLSILGFVYVYQGKLLTGFVIIAGGRLCDILDGYIAHYSGTKSTIGETVDAGLDKLVILVAFVVFASTEIVPFAPLVALGVQQLVAAALGGYARLKGLHMHPSRWGKYSAILQWPALLLYIPVAAASSPPGGIVTSLNAVFWISIFAGYVATYGYATFVCRVMRAR